MIAGQPTAMQRLAGEGEFFMLDEALLTKLLCVGFVAAFMLPFGGLLFPYVSNELSGIEFQAIEAVASATLAFGIYSVLG
jgi:hypothetical protein